MFELAAAGTGVLAAGACWHSSIDVRSRVTAVVMAGACLPMGPTWGAAAAAALMVIALTLPVGVRGRARDDRVLTSYRALAAVAMAAVMLAAPHGVSSGAGPAHAHGAGVAPAAVALAGVAALLIAGAVLWRRRAAHRAVRLELGATSIMLVVAALTHLAPIPGH
ncbi:hypothetical protein [Microbacterium stercoris]|uniref:Uncharacterized protein n=1 Tax=Microbacterium stercoris TaxID=2820289 RepID=A0A939QSU0_9MICO|nr:hypothetical protein [Microbacterium stercoris]MBO3664926.1 hypothetical protein [Microbacterium stercoris]